MCFQGKSVGNSRAEIINKFQTKKQVIWQPSGVPIFASKTGFLFLYENQFFGSGPTWLFGVLACLLSISVAHCVGSILHVNFPMRRFQVWF